MKLSWRNFSKPERSDTEFRHLASSYDWIGKHPVIEVSRDPIFSLGAEVFRFSNSLYAELLFCDVEPVSILITTRNTSDDIDSTQFDILEALPL